MNDDTIIVSPNWAPKLISTLASNPAIPNFGVTGPTDSNNEKIFTHAFVHRTHMEVPHHCTTDWPLLLLLAVRANLFISLCHVQVFGHLFPPYFKNWWSDDWISTVYGSEHTFRTGDVTIKHNVQAQKTKGYTRYQVDQVCDKRAQIGPFNSQMTVL